MRSSVRGSLLALGFAALATACFGSGSEGRPADGPDAGAANTETGGRGGDGGAGGSTNGSLAAALQAYCQRQCDCEGCGGPDWVAACAQNQERPRDAAHEQGCGAEYDLYAACYAERAYCKDGSFVSDRLGCDAESGAFSRCRSGR